jgi:pSer/pThr/pTyr-binding forkhead associated (FHA) protein
MAGDKTLHKIKARVPQLERLCPQQIVCTTTIASALAAALVDQWGRPHSLQAATLVGRELGHNDLAVLDSSVSRNHAEFRFDAGTWIVEDHGSTNGTFVEGQRISAATELHEGDRITLGEVGFAFVKSGASLLQGNATESIKRTLPSQRQEPEEPMLLLLGQVSGGGGIVEYDGNYVQLGPSQYALVHLLASSWLEETSQGEAVRGFVRSIDLIHGLPWETAYPEDNNVKQLVRRVRRAFDRMGVGDPIESRYGFGYRLRLTPQIQDATAKGS